VNQDVMGCMPIRTIIFDFGNVIGFFDHRLAVVRLARHSPLAADAIHGILFGGSLEDDYEAGRIDTGTFLQRLRDACQLRCTDEELTRAYSDIFWPNLEVCELLPVLARRYRLVLASNTTPLHTAHFLRQFAEPLRPFAALGLSHDAGARKPHRAFYDYIQGLAQAAPAECLFIDDLPANVEGGRAVGWHTHRYRDAGELRQRLAELAVL
jgi:FMN phosphatase YigB (HAD superfamily)